MKSYKPLQTNIRTEDQRILQSIPYMEDATGLNKFVDELKDQHEGIHGDYIVKTDDSILFSLFKEQMAELHLEPVDGFDVFQAICEIVPTTGSKNLVVQRFNYLMQQEEKKKPLSSPQSYDVSKSFISKFCGRCFTYNCILHEVASRPKPRQRVFYDNIEKGSDTCGSKCFKNNNNDAAAEMHLNLIQEDTWTQSDRTVFGALHECFTGRYCIISEVMQTKTCQQVRDFAILNLNEIHSPIIKRKSSSENHELKKRSTQETTMLGEKANDDPHYKPCECFGRCSAGCPCFDENRLCEKFCGCSIDKCSQRFVGCRCKAQCATNQCGCFCASRECDPDLCKCNINNKNSDKCCKNVSIQRRMKKHLLLGKSDVAGWGIFAKTAIEKGEFISVKIH